MRARLFILLLLFAVLVSYHGRLVEIASRLDFVWKETAVSELEEMAECRNYNTQLLRNILPDHVATYFLSNRSNNQVRLCGFMPTVVVLEWVTKRTFKLADLVRQHGRTLPALSKTSVFLD